MSYFLFRLLRTLRSDPGQVLPKGLRSLQDRIVKKMREQRSKVLNKAVPVEILITFYKHKLRSKSRNMGNFLVSTTLELQITIVKCFIIMTTQRHQWLSLCRYLKCSFRLMLRFPTDECVSIHEALQKKEMKIRISPIDKQIWLLPFMYCLYCLGIS